MKALLVIGIHREERAFGEAVAAGLSRRNLDVLAIEDGLSGRRPRPDQRFQYDTLHRALYGQLPSHVLGHYAMLIDLHTGLDRRSPCADLMCVDTGRLAGLADAVDIAAPGVREMRPGQVRLIQLCGGPPGAMVAETVIPESVWRNPQFLYVGVEVYLTEPGVGTPDQQSFAIQLVGALAGLLAQRPS
ncbi:MAG: hypothetical protein PHS77_07285 [Gallionellaceae bacterium]|nr:hypothetical protein [Gallionellaceae bacterium]